MRLDPILDWLAVILPLALSVLVALLPSPMSNRWRFIIVALGIAIAVIVLWQQTRARHHQEVVESQARQLAQPGIIATRDDIASLSAGMKDGFTEVLEAIKGVHARVNKPPEEVPPAVVRHLRFTEKRIASNSDKSPYALQVTIQTDVTMQPVSLRVRFDGDIDDAKFFEAGQAVYMNVRTSTQGNTFAFSFGFPPFPPESPIVVTVLSKSPVRVTQIDIP